MDLPNYLQALQNANKKCAERIRAFNKIGSSSVDAYSYIVGGLKILHPQISYRELCKSITDTDHDEQIDAVFISNGVIYIYDFKISIGFGENDIRLFKESVNKHLFLGTGNLTGCNELLAKRIKEARKLLTDEDYKVVLRVIRGGDNSIYPQGLQALQELTYDSIVEQQLYSLVDLINIELSLDRIPIKYKLKISAGKNNTSDTESQIIVNTNGTITSLICRVQLKELVDFYYDLMPNPERIFQSNVRGLQNTNKVSNEMLQSLTTSSKAKEFYKLHNGISIVCDKITSISGGKYWIHNPQVVNGCQTITTISKHFETDRNSTVLKYGTVIAKIFAANIKEVEDICFASNSQVAINPWDLRTNDKIQLVIESYLTKKGVKYHRKATKINNNNVLLFTELGQILCSALHEKPAFAKNSRAKIFSNSRDSLYHDIFPENLNLEEVYKVVSYALFMKQKIKGANAEDRKLLVPANMHFIAGFYLLRNKGKTPNEIFEIIQREIQSVIRIVKRRKGKSLTAPIIFTKHDLAWELLKAKLIMSTKQA